MFIKKVVTPVVIVASSIGAMAIPSISVAAHADEIAAFSGPLPMNQTFDPRMNVPTPAYRDPRETRRAPTYQTSVVPPLPSFPVMPQSGYGSPLFVRTVYRRSC